MLENVNRAHTSAGFKPACVPPNRMHLHTLSHQFLPFFWGRCNTEGVPSRVETTKEILFISSPHGPVERSSACNLLPFQHVLLLFQCVLLYVVTAPHTRQI
jgi:hypothetical protein